MLHHRRTQGSVQVAGQATKVIKYCFQLAGGTVPLPGYKSGNLEDKNVNPRLFCHQDPVTRITEENHAVEQDNDNTTENNVIKSL